MITAEESIPTMSDDFRIGLDIFYEQFNEISFYIEDEEQENFYFAIFKKLFPSIKLKKIFPLCGKKNVVDYAAANIGDKKKVFLVDKDFDDILGKKIKKPNLFYLKKYSIENYLIDKISMEEYVIEEKPKTKLKSVKTNFDFEQNLATAADLFGEITLHYILIQKWGLPIDNTSCAPERFIQFGRTFSFIGNNIRDYRNEIKNKLQSIDKRVRLDAQIKRIKINLGIRCWLDMISHIPGKYLIKFFKYRIEHLFSIASNNIDSFIYRLAKSNKFKDLAYLKLAINKYVS